MNNRCTRT